MPRDHRAETTPQNTSTIPCPGRHNDRWRYTETTDAEHDQAGYIPGDPVWCRDCADQIRRTLDYLPRLAATLHLEVEHATDPKREPVSGGGRTRALHRRAMRLTHKADPEPFSCIGVRCNTCATMALVHAVDRSGALTGEVLCQYCAATYTADEYRLLAGQTAALEHAYLTAEERTDLGAPVTAYEAAHSITDTEHPRPGPPLVDDRERHLRRLAAGPADTSP
jgi:hypothetical protein